MYSQSTRSHAFYSKALELCQGVLMHLLVSWRQDSAQQTAESSHRSVPTARHSRTISDLDGWSSNVVNMQLCSATWLDLIHMQKAIHQRMRTHTERTDVASPRQPTMAIIKATDSTPDYAIAVALRWPAVDAPATG